MNEKTLLPLAVIALLLLWVGTLGLWAVEAQKTVDDSGPSVSGNQESIEWKLVTTWPKGLPGLGSAPENFARRVGEMSNGRLTVRVYGAGEVVPTFEVFDAVSQGVAEMGHGASYYWKGK
ncbi:MAG: ABC transporter substrate-binding protein, partial [Luminiphilus sp.]|nr:ABC transporter substrate-binding protein [Luminiphilus sp.]